MLLLTPLASTVSGPVTAKAPKLVTGTVAFRQRIALPANARVSLSLEDSTSGSALAGCSYLASGSQVPLPFTLTVMPGAFAKGRHYIVRGKIEADGKTLFVGSADLPANKLRVEVSLSPAETKAKAPAGLPLKGTTWTLTEIDGHAPIKGLNRFPSFALDPTKEEIHGNLGVNGFGGTYTIHGDILTIMPGISTKMAGKPEVMAQEQQFRRILAEATGWKIDGNTLILKTGEDVLAKFRGDATP